MNQVEAALQKAVNLNKSNMDAFYLLAQIERSQGSVDKAIATVKDVLQNNPRDLRDYAFLGMLEEERGDWQAAREDYQKALQLSPNYAIAANNLAYLLLEHGGNVDDALTLAQTARRDLPDSPSTADTLAFAYYHKGLYRSAVALLRSALEKAPNNLGLNFHLGLAYAKLHEVNQARAHLERVLHLDPKYAHAADVRKTLAELGKA